jgi:hypothetical protein
VEAAQQLQVSNKNIMISLATGRLLVAVAASCLFTGQVGAWAAVPVVEAADVEAVLKARDTHDR